MANEKSTEPAPAKAPSVPAFNVAPRRKRADTAASSDEAGTPVAPGVALEPSSSPPSLAPRIEEEPTPPQPQQKAIGRLQTQRAENPAQASRLKALQRKKTNETRKMMNVPLSTDLRARLQKAAFDYDVKMTKIMVDAIDTYLTENGY